MSLSNEIDRAFWLLGSDHKIETMAYLGSADSDFAATVDSRRVEDSLT